MDTKDLNYYKNNCEEDYIKTPISVLRYITELEQALQLQQTSDWLRIVKTAYVIGLVGFPVEVNIDSLDYDKEIVNVSTKEGEKATRKFNEVYQFYSDCDFR